MLAKFSNIGILSIGEMGLGIARLLRAHGFEVLTYAADRSESTQDRAKHHGIALLSSIDELASQCDCVLSIVPPRDAVETARRISKTVAVSAPDHLLYYVDLNAISPRAARDIDQIFKGNKNIYFLDGGIIGGPPRPGAGDSEGPTWICPAIVVSGPTRLPDLELSKVLNVSHLEGPIGVATGLKMCFASTTKGLYALAIQSFTTAHRLGVLPELRSMMSHFNPAVLSACEKGVTGMSPKAYRWIHEMQEIATTMAVEGGFERAIFDGIADVYQTVTDDPALGQEKPGARKRGTTVEEVVELLSASMDKDIEPKE